MTDQKMRDAFNRLTAQGYQIGFNDFETGWDEALASAQPEGPELTDAEIDEIWARHAMSDTFDCVHLLRDAIAADRARRGGVEEKSPSAAEIAENVAALEESRNSEWGKAAQEWAATPPAAPVVPEEWRDALLALADRIEEAGEKPLVISRQAAESLRALLATPSPAPEQREKVELTDKTLRRLAAQFVTEIKDSGHHTRKAIECNDAILFARAVIAAHEAKQSGGEG